MAAPLSSGLWQFPKVSWASSSWPAGPTRAHSSHFWATSPTSPTSPHSGQLLRCFATRATFLHFWALRRFGRLFRHFSHVSACFEMGVMFCSVPVCSPILGISRRGFANFAAGARFGLVSDPCLESARTLGLPPNFAKLLEFCSISDKGGERPLYSLTLLGVNVRNSLAKWVSGWPGGNRNLESCFWVLVSRSGFSGPVSGSGF